LKEALRRRFKDRPLLALFDRLIDSHGGPDRRGVPIGNLTSQFFANLYLDGLDHFVKEQLKASAYLRYVDDMILLADDKTQ